MNNTNTSGWTDAILIREIRVGGRRRNTAWEYIYKAWRRYYLAPAIHAGGTEEEVDEVLSGVILDVEKQLLKPDFELREASLRTYLVGSIIKAWWRSQRDSKRRPTVELDPQTYTAEQHDSVETEFIRRERFRLLDAALDKLGEKCRTILMQAARGFSNREIAAELGFQNEQSVKNKKVACHRKLLELTDNL